MGASSAIHIVQTEVPEENPTFFTQLLTLIQLSEVFVFKHMAEINIENLAWSHYVESFLS